ncbi:hypothetical protein EVAR_73543_1 [Eumeta japonica]|uniref:Uncharacterized protein n=1 Tax=Eumeta variegata TaxID=151549 RepID=A0A4C1TLD4_EUMVA|nr:hypothetical protein EVAR_73543_1 [Eumeta japonica]
MKRRMIDVIQIFSIKDRVTVFLRRCGVGVTFVFTRKSVARSPKDGYVILDVLQANAWAKTTDGGVVGRRLLCAGSKYQIRLWVRWSGGARPRPPYVGKGVGRGTTAQGRRPHRSPVF